MKKSPDEQLVPKKEEQENVGFLPYAEAEKKRKQNLKITSTEPWCKFEKLIQCQAENCKADLAEAKAYFRKHKVCEVHSKDPVVMVCGLRQRFCQQCSRFHSVTEFDDTKRSCRRRLAGHNERRRNRSYEEPRGESSKQKRRQEASYDISL
ncbi:hypothetical protein ACHQM5_003261 [Ranunculus cassubicifolius]